MQWKIENIALLKIKHLEINIFIKLEYLKVYNISTKWLLLDFSLMIIIRLQPKDYNKTSA